MSVRARPRSIRWRRLTNRAELSQAFRMGGLAAGHEWPIGAGNIRGDVQSSESRHHGTQICGPLIRLDNFSRHKSGRPCWMATFLSSTMIEYRVCVTVRRGRTPDRLATPAQHGRHPSSRKDLEAQRAQVERVSDQIRTQAFAPRVVAND